MSARRGGLGLGAIALGAAVASGSRPLGVVGVGFLLAWGVTWLWTWLAERPVTLALDFGLSHEEFSIWFGVLTLIVVEVGLISPPVGMNLFVINSMSKGTTMGQTFAGVTPFLVSDLVRTVILVAFPPISLFLVQWLY